MKKIQTKMPAKKPSLNHFPKLAVQKEQI